MNLEPEITVFDNKRKITDFSNGKHTKLAALIRVYSPQKLQHEEDNTLKNDNTQKKDKE